MKLFLQLKPWQICVLINALLFVTVALVLLLSRWPLIYLFSSGLAFYTFIGFTLLPFILLGIVFSWLYAVGTSFSKMLPHGTEVNISLFKILIFLLFVCTSFLIMIQQKIITAILIAHEAITIDYLFALALLYLFIAYGVLFCFRFISKILRMIELQKSVSFFDYYQIFFLLLLFPVGIGFIQSRINRIYKIST